MILSKKAKLVFIHIPKNSGKSVKVAMMGKFGDSRQIAHSHTMIKEKKSLVGKYKTFAVVRNPWDRIVSMYSFLCQFKRQVKTRKGTISREKLKEIGFKRWLLDYGKISHKIDVSTTPQLNWVSVKGYVVSKIVRFEDLTAGLRDIGIELGENKKHATARVSYSEYYDDETRAYVNKHFAKDIIEWRYGFEYLV